MIIRYWLIIGLSSKVRLSIEDVVERFTGCGVLCTYSCRYACCILFDIDQVFMHPLPVGSTPYLDVAR